MKKMMIPGICIAIIVIACSKSNEVVTTVDCSGEAKSFATDVRPVIQSSCTSSSGCHASGSTNGPGPLVTYQQVFNARLAIRAAVANGSMPQNSSLSAAQKNSIICWIDNGAISN